MSGPRIIIEFKDEDGKILRTADFLAEEIRIDTRQKHHSGKLIGETMFRLAREAAVNLLKRRDRPKIVVERPWTREHERPVWHFEAPGETSMLCGAVIPGSPSVQKDRPQPEAGELCDECDRQRSSLPSPDLRPQSGDD